MVYLVILIMSAGVIMGITIWLRNTAAPMKPARGAADVDGTRATPRRARARMPPRGAHLDDAGLVVVACRHHCARGSPGSALDARARTQPRQH